MCITLLAIRVHYGCGTETRLVTLEHALLLPAACAQRILERLSGEGCVSSYIHPDENTSSQYLDVEQIAFPHDGKSDAFQLPERVEEIVREEYARNTPS